MSAIEQEIIAATSSLFSRKVRDLLPLRHMCHHQNEAEIRDVAKQEIDKGCVYFIKKLTRAPTISVDRRGILVSEFCTHLKKLVDEYVAANEEYKAKWQSFLENRIEGLCKDMKAYLEMKIAMNPDMNQLELEGCFESRKVTVMTYFEWMWKEGNRGTFEEQKNKLEQKLQDLKKEMLEKQRTGQGPDERKACGDGNELVMEAPLQIRNEADAAEECPNREVAVLKEEMKDIAERLKHVCSILSEICGKLGAQPQGFLGGRENLPVPVEADSRLTEDLDLSQDSLFIEEKNETPEVQQQPMGIVDRTSNGNKTLSSEVNDTVEESGPDEPNQQDEPLADDGLDDDGGVPIESTGGEMSESEAKFEFDISEENILMDHESEEGVVNAPEGDEYVPPQPLRAISEGQSVASIQKLLDAGANVNASWSNGFNAAHLAMLSVINGKWTSSEALAVLNLLMAKGFSIINQKIVPGHTPLLLALELENLDEEILNWFYENGADFNVAENEFGKSVLFEAIIHGFDAKLIRKILEFGADPKHVNKKNDSALHVAAYCAHDAALQIFVDHLDVNGVNEDNSTPLSMLFMQSNLKYESCLELLLGKGADLRGSCDKGCANTLVHWLKHGKENPFPALMSAMDRLPITEEIASATLTTIVEEIACLEKFLLSSSELEQHAFAQFTVFLIEEKNAKLVPRGEGNRKLQDLKDLKKFLLANDFLEKLRNSGIIWEGELMKIKSANLVKLEFQTDCSSDTVSVLVSVPTEVVLGCLMACGSYEGFVKVCQSLSIALKEHDA